MAVFRHFLISTPGSKGGFWFLFGMRWDTGFRFGSSCSFGYFGTRNGSNGWRNKKCVLGQRACKDRNRLARGGP